MQQRPAKAAHSKAWYGFAQLDRRLRMGEDGVSGVSGCQGLGTARTGKAGGQHVPTAQIEIVSGAGHFPMLEAPEVVNQAIAAFAAQVPQ
jgi:pimeloyl-ACP methyl ester carboxylesterase